MNPSDDAPKPPTCSDTEPGQPVASSAEPGGSAFDVRRAATALLGRPAELDARPSFEIVDGSLSTDLINHLASCDACRDHKHALSFAAERIAHAADDVLPSPALDTELEASIRDEKAQLERQASASGRIDEVTSDARRRGKPSLYTLLGAAGVAVVFGVLSLFSGSREGGTISRGGARVERLSSASDDGGLSVCAPNGSPCSKLLRGDRISSGSLVMSDAATRAEVELSEGVRLLVERNTEFVLADDGSTAIELLRGVLTAEVRAGESLGLQVRHGTGKLGPGSFHLRSTGEDAMIEVIRGGADPFARRDVE